MIRNIIGLLLLFPSLVFAAVFKTNLYGYVEPYNASIVASQILNAKKGDVVVINIQSTGGQMQGGDMIRAAISRSSATVVANVQGEALSEAAYITIACDRIQGSGILLFHLGNAPPQASIKALRGLLTSKEMQALKAGEDIVLSVSTVKARLNK